MHCICGTLWPDREQQLAEYLGPYQKKYNPYEGREFCPICGDEIRFGQHAVEGPNDYLLHSRCYEGTLHEAAEADEDISDPQGEWIADAISEAILDRDEQYNTDKFPQLWKSKI